MTKAKGTFSIFRYLTSGPYSTLLMKYTGYCCRASSLTRALATTTLLTERYKINGLPTSSLLNIGGLERYLLNSVNVASQFRVHSKVLSFFNREKRVRPYELMLP